MKHLVLHHQHTLTLAEILAVGDGTMKVSLAKETQQLLQMRRQQIEAYLQAQKKPAYGFNRGFGHNVDLPVRAEDLLTLQENLILSHAVGTGGFAEKSIVRMTMLLRARSLAKGYSGVRPALVLKLIEFLNQHITPLVPELGSVGASGDLAPLSHIALALIGKGKVCFGDEVMETSVALQQAKLEPLELQAKEGLALNNGVQFMNALGLHACQQLRTFLKTECAHTALVAQVMLAPDIPYREDFHQVRPHPGAMKVARWIWDLMQHSPLREMHREYDIDGQIQDPYNLRCAAQILGSCAELIDDAEKSLLIEANSATDNPILLPLKHAAEGDEKYQGHAVDIISGGHFHGMPLAVKIFNLFQALSIVANLAHQRTVRFVDQAKNKRLGRDLKWPFLPEEQMSISNGMMMLEYTSAALLNDIWGSCTPSHLFNISTNSGQEDHVSMGTSLAVRLCKTLPKAAHVLAIELAYLTQAVAIRKALDHVPTEIPIPHSLSEEIEALQKKYHQDDIDFEINALRQYHITPEQKKMSPPAEAIFEAVQKIFPVVKNDRYLADEMEQLAQWIEQGHLLEIIRPFEIWQD